MLNRYFFFVPVAIVGISTACSAPPHQMSGPGGAGGIILHEDCDDNNDCTIDSEDGAGCSHVPAAAGTICFGNAADPIHGECNPDGGPTCDITDWTCPHGKPGDKCNGGVCDRSLVCCSGGCINADGFCDFGGTGGVPCPN